ncbi:hypothetical protein BDZ97DRAFT_1769925 [Flammula alnicola]|nr:hypothetical protein BDZ97DRAFT_1769925 [Flammula alnicola]
MQSALSTTTSLAAPVSNSIAFWTFELWKVDLRCESCDLLSSLSSAKVPGKAELIVVEITTGTFSCWLEESLTWKGGSGGIRTRDKSQEVLVFQSLYRGFLHSYKAGHKSTF